MLFFLVEGVSSQTVNLPIKGGYNWEATDGTNNWTNESDVSYTTGTVKLKDNAWGENNHITNCALGGTHWATTFNEGDTHTFTVTLDAENVGDLDLHIVAVDATNNTNNLGGSFSAVATNNINTTSSKTLTLEVTNNYAAVYLYSTSDGSKTKIYKITSITRTVTGAAPSVNAPTISPASGTYDGNLSVTITKGEGNRKVVYSVSGAKSGNETDAEFEEASKTLNLTGTGTITVTAIGYDSENNPSSEVRNTYTTDVPSGKTSIASDNHTLPYTFNSADDNIEFNQNKFNNENIVIGNYVVLDINVTNDNTWFCFKRGWGDDYFNQCTSIYSGSTANNCWVNQNDTYWWMKISDQNAINAFTGNNVQIKGSKIKDTNSYSAMTVNSFSIYESKVISEAVNNTISSKENNVVVELTRSFVKDTWNTVCLPFTLTSAQATQLFGSGYKLAQFTGVSGTTMQFTTTDSFVAGVPYLVKPTKTVSNASPVVLVDVSITAKTPQTVTYGGYSFVGNFTQKTFSGDECSTSRFVAAGNELMKPENGSTLKSLRCYFTVPAGLTMARSFTVDEEGNTTGVADINRETITNNGDFFNLAGQRVAKPTKGLYIVDGKKVVIK